MDNLDFSEDEIREQLAIMGYENIPKHRLREFKRDLDQLIRHGEWKSLTPTPQRNSTVSPTAVLQTSPPAYIKEKVTQSHFEDSGQGFFLHAGHTGHDRRSGERGRQPGPRDSYAQHSVAPTLRLAPGAPSRLQVEPDPDDTLPPPLTDSCVSSPDARGRRFIRRKVLRKHEGQSLVCDESIYSEDSDATSRLEEELEELRLSPQCDGETEDEDEPGQSDVQSSEEGFSVSAIMGMIPARRDKPKSFIRPAAQATKKTDPVTKYYQYKQFWDMFKLPGESDRRALRLEVKERLEYQPPPPKPRRVCAPNTYVVPTEKKRSALRWQIRNDLANRLLPYKFGCLL